MEENSCCCGCVDESEQKLLEVIEEHKDVRGALITILHETQEIYGYLPERAQKIISEKLNISMAEIYGVITFYTRFSLKPKGKYTLELCMGTACYVKGSGKILEKLEENLGIAVGNSTDDGLFSLETCRCVGACGLAPVLVVGGKVYGRVKPEEVGGIIEDYRKKESENLDKVAR